MFNYKVFKNYLIIFILSLFFGLYLFEMYLNFKSVNRGSDIEKNSAILKKEKNLEYDARSKHEIYKSMKLDDKNITVSVSPRVFNDPDKKLHFLSGISKSKTIDCNENGYFSIYKSDRYGFNNPDKEWENSEIDYILVGDSYTHGACVNRPNDIASIFRNLSNKKVINLGYKANGPLSMYASLKEYKSNKTKNILWMYYEGNDLQDLDYELKIGHLKKYILNKSYFQNLKEKQDYIDAQNHKILLKSIKAWDKAREQTIKNSNIKYKILKFIRFDKTKNFIKSIIQPKNISVPLNEFETILRYTKELADSEKAKLYFVYLPQFERYKTKIKNNNFIKVREIVNSLNINFIDIDKEVFQNEKEPLKLFPFQDWGHYNEEGYRKIGELLFRKIEKKNIVD
tara:strand:- start:137 stop:1330 length:1194 start_codon:yes stop_codon:yes gene_type:complete